MRKCDGYMLIKILVIIQN